MNWENKEDSHSIFGSILDIHQFHLFKKYFIRKESLILIVSIIEFIVTTTFQMIHSVASIWCSEKRRVILFYFSF